MVSLWRKTASFGEVLGSGKKTGLVLHTVLPSIKNVTVSWLFSSLSLNFISRMKLRLFWENGVRIKWDDTSKGWQIVVGSCYVLAFPLLLRHKIFHYLHHTFKEKASTNSTWLLAASKETELFGSTPAPSPRPCSSRPCCGHQEAGGTWSGWAACDVDISRPWSRWGGGRVSGMMLSTLRCWLTLTTFQHKCGLGVGPGVDLPLGGEDLQQAHVSLKPGAGDSHTEGCWHLVGHNRDLKT